MKYPCHLIQDLLPLYVDQICSEQTNDIIKEHLDHCITCKAYYDELMSADKAVEVQFEKEAEQRKAASFQAVKRKLQTKQMLISVISIVCVAVLFWIGIGSMKSAVHLVEYDNNLSVSVVDDSIVARIYGTQEVHVKGKNISVEIDGEIKVIHLFSVSSSLWNDAVMNDTAFSEFVLCPSDKGADEISQVYYYTGSTADIESMQTEEIQHLLNQAILLWEKK